jgi:dinuclear metal center YbgI/SA1388 family protein
MKIHQIIAQLEMLAPLSLQESYDNAGLITGDSNQICSGVLITLDATEMVVEEAIEKGCNLIVAHHPILFRGIKQLTGKDYVERTIIKAIKNDIAIYAIHTNLDSVLMGVNHRIAEMLELSSRKILQPKRQLLQKLQVYVPETHVAELQQALFDAGAGNIGKYSECSFVSEGVGSFKPEATANPFSGTIGTRQTDKELKLEVIFPVWIQAALLRAMRSKHPYEEIAYQITSIENDYQDVGSGMIGNLAKPMDEVLFLDYISSVFNNKVVKRTSFIGKKIEKVAICGGSGSFLIQKAIACGADAFITSDIKYHEFFDADGRILLADVGHFESEQYTIELLHDFLREKFPNFALQKSEIRTNPVFYHISKMD